jgi:hypothetical protein
MTRKAVIKNPKEFEWQQFFKISNFDEYLIKLQRFLKYPKLE